MSLINDALKRAKQAQQKQTTNRPVIVPLQPADGGRPSHGFPVWLVPLVLVAVLLLSGWFFVQWWRAGSSPPGQLAEVPSSYLPVNPVPIASSSRSDIPSPAMTPPPVNANSKASGSVLERPKTSMAIRVSTNLVMRTIPPAGAVQTTGPTTVEQATDPADVVTQNPAVARSPQETKPDELASPVTAPAITSGTPSTSPVTKEPASLPELRLQAVYYRRVKPSALINGETLFEGESVDGATVLKIERQSVVVEWKGQKTVLRIGRR